MKNLIAAVTMLAGITSTCSAMDCGCGPIAPAVPVITYYGQPAVNYTPGHWYGAGPYCCDTGYGGYYGRGPITTTRVYYPYQPVRNVLRVLAP